MLVSMANENQSTRYLISERVMYVLQGMQSGRFAGRAASVQFALLDGDERVQLLDALSSFTDSLKRV
jgi:hypothetical protein